MKEEEELRGRKAQVEEGRFGFSTEQSGGTVQAAQVRGTVAAFYLQLLKDFLLGLELVIWLALLVALHKHSLPRSGACGRVQRLNLAAVPFPGKTRGTRKE